MKIAMVGLRGIGPGIAGGIERHVEELAVRMAAGGHDVTVFGRSPYVKEAVSDYHGVRLLAYPAVHTKHLETITNVLAAQPALVRGFDIVHFHALGPSLLSFIPRLAGRAVVTTVHGLDYQRAKWGLAAKTALYAGAWAAGRFANETIVVSNKLVSFYAERFRRATHYIPNGVNAPESRPLERLAARFGLAKGEYFLSLGRLTPEKGLHYLIPAFRKVPGKTKLVVAGEQQLGSGYLRRLQELAAGDGRIIFSGALHGPEKDEAFTNALAFVLPSDLEGMPIVMLEAMSYACPVLSSDIEECAEVWRTARAEAGVELCRSFRAGDIDDLAAGLAGLTGETETELGGMGARAREYVLGKYNWDDIARSTLEVYAGALRRER